MAEAAKAAITHDCLSTIFNDPDKAMTVFPVPVLQCLQIKPLQATTSVDERYRLVVSDMTHFAFGMLGTKNNDIVRNAILQRNSIIRVRSYQATPVKGKNVLIIVDLEVLDQFQGLDKLGEPKAQDKPAGEQQQPAANPTIAGNSFYGVKEEKPKPQPAPARNVVDRKQGSSNIYPIEAISPYSHKWTVKARVTQKSDIRTWHKANSGEGKLFSVNLLDESGEIKATGFNEQCDQFYNLFEEGSVYYISTPCKVQFAKKQFTNLPNDFELTFERDTVIEKAEDQSDVPQVRFNFCSLGDLQSIEKDATVDVIGVLKDVGDVSQITSKSTGKPYEKRELTLVDDSNYSVRVTIWGKSATAFDSRVESVIAFKGVKVSDFGGRSLSLLSSGTINVDPDIQEAHRLKGWYDASGRTDSFATHSNATIGGATGRQDVVKLISQVKEENLGTEKDEYFSVKATVLYMRQENFCYPACSSDGCNKKVTETGDNMWLCEKCNVTHSKPQYRYIMSLNVCDHTGQMWVSIFDEVGRALLGMSADEVMALEEGTDERAAVFERATFKKVNMRVRAKMDTYGDQQRVRYQVMSAAPIDFASEGNKLAEMMKQWSM